MKNPVGGVVLAILLGTTSNAFALQPLSQFIRESRKHAMPNQIAQSIVEERNAHKDATFWKLFPSFSSQVSYHHNPYELSLDVTLPNGNKTTRVVTPTDAFSGRAALAFTLDLEAYRRYRASAQDVDVAKYDADAEAQKVEIEIARSYYQVLAGINQVEIAANGVASSEKLFALAQARREAGSASQADVDRATIELEKARDAQAESNALLDDALKTLSDLSGLVPDTARATFDLPASPAPLASIDPWLSNVYSTPGVRVAKANESAADAKVNVAQGSYYPKVTFEVSDTLTNTPGFYGEYNTWGAGATATWNFDLSIRKNVREARAAKKTASLRVQRAAEEAKRAIEKMYAEVEIRRRHVKTAKLEADLTSKNLEEAKARYEGGLESIDVLLQLQRETLAAEVRLTQAYSDYLLGKSLLNITAGKDLIKE